MTKSEDIVNLFQQFGGQVDDYQELSRQQSAQQAKKRWPLLSALELGQATAATAPGVAAAEAPVTAGPIEFRPAPIAPPVQVLAPTGQHLSAAELALGAPAATTPAAATPAAAAAPVPVQPEVPAQATTLPNLGAVAAVAVTPAPAPAAAPALHATVPTPMHGSAPTATVAVPTPAVGAPAPAAPVIASRAPEPAAPAVAAPWFSPPPAPAAAPVPLSAPSALTSTSPLASLAQTARPTPVPSPPPAPTTELQGIFARLAGRVEVAPPPPPSGLTALWQNLRGGA